MASENANMTAGATHSQVVKIVLLQAAVGRDVKPLLGRISSKVGGLLEELNDMLGALEGVPSAEGGDP